MSYTKKVGMKIRFITNAGFEIITGETRILCDPWLLPGAFDGSWWQWPPLRLTPEDFREYTHLYISHIHPDHCDLETLRRLPNKEVPVIILKGPGDFLKKRIATCGFTNFIELADGESAQLADVAVTMYGAFAANPFIDAKVPNIIDSSIVVTHGDSSFLNLNDNEPDAAACERLVNRHGHFCAAMVPYGGVGPWPSSYLHLSTEEKLKKAREKEGLYLGHMLTIAKILKADIYFPAAGQMRLGGRMSYKNEFLGIVNQKTAVQRLVQAGYRAAHLEEGDVFTLGGLEHKKTLSLSVPTQAQMNAMERAPYGWEAAFQVPANEQQELLPLLQEARQRMWTYQERFRFTADWLMAIEVEEHPEHVYVFSYADPSPVRKILRTELVAGQEKFLLVRIPYNYLIAILTRHCHWNNAYHGCLVEWWRRPDNPYLPELQILLSFFHL